MTLYFQRHDGQAVTCDDFAQAIADANPGSELAQRAAAVQALVQPGRHAARDGARPLRRAVAHLHPRPRAVAGGRRPARPAQRAVRDPAGDRPAGARRPGAARCASRTSPRPRRRRTGCWCSTSTKAFFTFVDVDEPPVPSLLRGFSAPVMPGRRPRRRRAADPAGHDTDPFNRWEAGQRLALNRLLAADRAATSRRRSTRPSSRRCARCCATRARRRRSRTGADAAERDLHRRAARQRRPAARPRGARSDARQLAHALRRRLGVGLRGAPGQRRLLARPGLRRAAARWPTWP